MDQANSCFVWDEGKKVKIWSFKIIPINKKIKFIFNDHKRKVPQKNKKIKSSHCKRVQVLLVYNLYPAGLRALQYKMDSSTN